MDHPTVSSDKPGIERWTPFGNQGMYPAAKVDPLCRGGKSLHWRQKHVNCQGLHCKFHWEKTQTHPPNISHEHTGASGCTTTRVHREGQGGGGASLGLANSSDGNRTPYLHLLSQRTTQIPDTTHSRQIRAAFSTLLLVAPVTSSPVRPPENLIVSHVPVVCRSTMQRPLDVPCPPMKKKKGKQGTHMLIPSLRNVRNQTCQRTIICLFSHTQSPGVGGATMRREKTS